MSVTDECPRGHPRHGRFCLQCHTERQQLRAEQAAKLEAARAARIARADERHAERIARRLHASARSQRRGVDNMRARAAIVRESPCSIALRELSVIYGAEKVHAAMYVVPGSSSDDELQRIAALHYDRMAYLADVDPHHTRMAMPGRPKRTRIA